MTDHPSQKKLHELTARWLPSQSPEHRFRVFRDTTDFFRIEFGDVVVLDSVPFLVRHNAKEGRFGLDDEVKFWVKRAIDLNTGETKVIKMVFFEKFVARIGGIEFECFRSPRKEARILKLVNEHENFMHGYSVHDDQDNIVRILDHINGDPLSEHVKNMARNMSHEHYFHEEFPAILNNYVECAEAIRFLHERGEKHGDIRRDHIIIDRESGVYRWIDFDYNFRHRENMYGYDLFGLGNVLMFLVGMGDVLMRELRDGNHPAFGDLKDDDVNIVFNNRVANLKKIYPYIPESLNRILLHFSKGAKAFYDHTSQLLDDLSEVRKELCYGKTF